MSCTALRSGVPPDDRTRSPAASIGANRASSSHCQRGQHLQPARVAVLPPSSFSELVAIVAIRDSQSTRRRRMKSSGGARGGGFSTCSPFERSIDSGSLTEIGTGSSVMPSPSGPICLRSPPCRSRRGPKPQTRPRRTPSWNARSPTSHSRPARPCSNETSSTSRDTGHSSMHPGICPEYRNSHGCFWALARRDLDHVGATLLQIDEGSDTGPVYAYYTTITMRNRSRMSSSRPGSSTTTSRASSTTSRRSSSLMPVDVSGRIVRRMGPATPDRLPALETRRPKRLLTSSCSITTSRRRVSATPSAFRALRLHGTNSIRHCSRLISTRSRRPASRSDSSIPTRRSQPRRSVSTMQGPRRS